MAKALVYVELDIPYCSLTYGVAPCTASLTASPPTGTRKCFNSKTTCQDRANFLDKGAPGYSPYTPTTLRFAVDTNYLPDDIWCLPFIEDHGDIEITPAIISLGVDLGQRATVKIKMRDSRYSDTGPGGDKYLSERDYNPFDQGTFFGKFRARHPFLRGRNLRLITGTLGQTLEQMETRHFVVDSINGPNNDGDFEIIGKDILKLADGDRSQVPELSNGVLLTDIAAGATTVSLSPTGIGDEYGETGFLSVGGNEVVEFWRDADAQNDLGVTCKLLIHCDGIVSSFDDEAQGRTVTRGSGATIEINNPIFVGQAVTFDATANGFLSLADDLDWTPSADFTWDFWLKATSSLSGDRIIFSQRQDANNEQRLWIKADGTLQYFVVSGGSTIIDVASAAGAIVLDTIYHIALVRNGTNFRLYRNGVSIASITDADAIPNFGATLFFAKRSDDLNAFSGSMDEIRLTHTALWTTNFTPPIVPAMTSVDELFIQRAKFNTDAEAHSLGDRVQQLAAYEAQDVADIIYDLMTSYAGISPGYIDLPSWQDETETFLGVVYSGVISEPTGVASVISELIEQAGLVVWWDDVNQRIGLQVLRGIDTSADRFTMDNTIELTLKATDQPDKRLSRITVYFGKINPLLKNDELSNYRSTTTGPDNEDSALAEDDYGSPAIKTIYSRWIPEGGKVIADRLIAILYARYRDPPRRFEFEVMRGGLTPQLAQGYRVEGWFLQDDTGAATDAPIQLTRLNPRADRIKVEGEEMLFTASDVDLSNRVIVIDTNTFNFNARTAHDNIYPAAASGDTVTFRVIAGVTVGSTSIDIPAFDVGSWASGVILILDLSGRIQGRGGNGADQTTNPGQYGGTALYTRYAIGVTGGGTGEIWGGGGGGAGGINNLGRGVGGGGGAGTNPGSGGYGNFAFGSNGTATAGGAGGNGEATIAGTGGAPGAAGGSGTILSGSWSIFLAAGSGGIAIDGDSFVTFDSPAVDIQGGQVN